VPYRNQNQWPLARIAPVAKYTALLLVLTLLSGCGDDLGDLQAHVDDVKAKKPSGIEPLPKVKPYKSFSYVAENRRDPFDSSIIADLTQAGGPRGDPSLRPDPNRIPEFLESFPLDTLRMVGTLELTGDLWALVKTPDGTIQRVREGNYAGHNNGQITKITDDEILLAEIVPDGFEGWMERESSIALSR